ncbi:MAG: PKD domain-containing protein, partial [bacterium]
MSKKRLIVIFFVIYSAVCYFSPSSRAQELMADAGPDQVVLVDEVVAFNAEGSSGAIATYEWDFGDGTTGEGRVAQHIYTAVGSYRVILTIKDADENTKTDSAIVTVEHGLPPEYNENAGAYSPDGRKIAYHSDCRGNWDIWVRNADGSGSPIAITIDEANDVNPSWSPDGTQIVFSSNRSGNGDLYIKNADGSGEARRLTTDNSYEETQPSWSPDGRWIAYRHSHCNYHIYAINIDGSRNTRITEYCNEQDPDWSPDGKRLVYYYGTDIYTKIVDGNGDGYPDNSASRVRITTHSAADYYPSWSPDGARIAFSSNRSGNYHIWEKNADGTGGAVQITSSAELFDHWIPHWSPDGCRIIYQANETGTNDIFKIDYKDDESAYPLANINLPKLNQTLSGTVDIIGTAANNISVSDGSTLLSELSSYTLEYGEGENPQEWIEITTSSNQVVNGILGYWNTMELSRGIYTLRLCATDGVDTNTQKVKVIIEHQHLLVPDKANEAHPAYSPEGTKIAYGSTVSGNWDIWVRNVDGSGEPIQVTTDGATDYLPCWSPDGTQIAFYSSRTGNGDIYIKNADGTGDARRLTTDDTYQETQPSWSPDGKWIAYRHSHCSYHIYVINIDGSRNTRITEY